MGASALEIAETLRRVNQLSKGKAKISSMIGLNVTDLMSDWFYNRSTECRMSALSIYILFLQLSPISIFVTRNWLRDVAWSRDMTWDTIQMLRHGLSCLRFETRSEPRHETDKVSINMRRERDETRNTWNAEYMRRGKKLRCMLIRQRTELRCIP